MRTMYILLFIFIAHAAIAQCDKTGEYGEMDKDAFVRAYLKVKKEKEPVPDQQLYELCAAFDITPSQFQEIQHREKHDRALTVNENEFLVKLLKIKEEYSARHLLFESSICEELGLSHDRYKSIEQAYKSCIKFQRSLSANFDKWMER